MKRVVGVIRIRGPVAAALLLVCGLACGLACGPELAVPTTSEGEDASTSAGDGGSSGGTTSGGTTSGGTTSTGGGETTAGLTDAEPETTGSTGCEFICEDDTPVDPDLCDIFVQDCPEGKKCESVDTDGDGAWDTNKCVPIMGDGVLGEPCTAEGATGIDTCAKGYLCWNVDENGDGTCFAHCTGSPESPVCDECTSCVIAAGGVIVICLPGCDPLAQDCPGSDVCIGDPNADGFVCVLDASGGMAPAGTPCEFANVCNPGNMCASPEAVPLPDCEGWIGCCTPFCDYEQPGDTCDALALPGVECVPYHDEPLPPESCLGAVGVCLVP